MSKNKQTDINGSGASITKDEYMVAGMDCADCALHVEKEVGKLPGVSKVVVNVITGKMEVYRSSAEPGDHAVDKAVRGAGYRLRSENTIRETFLVLQKPTQNQLDELRGQKSIKAVQYNQKKFELQILHIFSAQDMAALLQRSGIKIRSKRSRIFERSFLKIGIGHLIISGISVLIAYTIDYFSYNPLLFRLLILTGILAGGYPLIWRGLKEIKTSQFGMNFLMMTAVTGALIIGEWNEGAMVVFLFILAQWLESKTMDRARRSIGSLLEQKPRMARRWVAQKEELVPVEDIMPGEIVAVKPGELIPLDGVVQTGKSFVNESTITGESMPVELKPGRNVFAGTLNQNGYVEIEVRRRYSESTYAQIADIVAEAQAKKAPKQVFVERFTRFYTPAVIGIALVIAFVVPAALGVPFIEWFYRALVLLVIACPCAFVISTPITIVSALTNAMRNGILIKGGVFLEEFARLKSMAFDKTGTITNGTPSVQEVHCLQDQKIKDVMSVACALEQRADHPIASAIVAYGASENIEIPDAKNVRVIEGKGVEGEIDGKYFLVGNHLIFEEKNLCDSKIHIHLEEIEDASHTAILVGNENAVIGVISVADSIRPHARQMIDTLRKQGISHLFLLTGDNMKTATEIARQVNIDNVHADLLPKAKMEMIEYIKKNFGPVSMIGDGVNDAPALASADIGIAMGASGSDTAIKTADIALMQNDLQKLPYLKELSNKTIRVIKENIFIALSLKFTFLFLAIPGYATLWMAVFADMGASLIVIFNGLRVLRSKSLN